MNSTAATAVVLFLALFLVVYFPVIAGAGFKTAADNYYLGESKNSTYCVVPYLKDGLGNQLFVLAAAVVYGTVNKKEVRIPKASLYNPHEEKEKYSKTIFRGFQTVDFPVDEYTPTFTVVDHTDKAWLPWSTAEPPGGIRNVYLSGFFFHFPTLAPYESLLISTFTRNLPHRSARLETVGIHVRRGDYVQAKFILLPALYYENCMRFIQARAGSRALRFLIFSNDLKWCREQAIFKNCYFNDEEDGVECMADMASCKAGFICANSTFSWWGAFLGAHASKGIICAPSLPLKREWASACPQTGNLYPPLWHII